MDTAGLFITNRGLRGLVALSIQEQYGASMAYPQEPADKNGTCADLSLS